jgi:hypothetical protein
MQPSGISSLSAEADPCDHPGVSYTLAVWDGDTPANDKQAAAECDRLVELTEDDDIPPTPKIRRYVETLLARWPDIGEEGGENSPWADGPLMNNASGPLFLFGLSTFLGEEPFIYCQALAKEQGLVFFDPAEEQLLE